MVKYNNVSSQNRQAMNRNNQYRLPDIATHEHLASGRVISILGEGGTSIVYQIWNEQLSVKRAVKLLKPNASIESHERFSQEMKIMAQLSHPNIINVHSVGQWNNLPYIEMDYVDGSSLEDLLAQEPKLPLVVSVAIAIEIAKALNYTHNHRYYINNVEYKGLLHRDIKPGNILLPRHDTLRLTDFGIATLSTMSTTSLTKTGKIIGSMQYLAPEQLEDKKIDHRSDIYSFGAVLYELLTGHKLFEENNVSKLVRDRVKNQITPIEQYKLKIPKDLISLTKECIAISPNDRPDSMKTVLQRLNEVYRGFQERVPDEVLSKYLNGEEVKLDSELPKIKKKRNPIKSFFLSFSLIFILVIMIIIGGGYFYIAKYKPVLLDEILGIFATTSIEDIAPAPGETVKVNVIVKKMKKDTKRSSKHKQLPNKLPNVGDIKADTISPLVTMMNDANMSDTLAFLQKLEEDGEYTKILAVYPYLSTAQHSNKIAQLMRHRAIIALGQESKTYYDSYHISDAEYYLTKGLYLYNRRQFQRAIWIFRTAQSQDAALINKNLLLRELLYYTAKSEDSLLAIRPTEQRRSSDLRAWVNLESFLSNNVNDPYYKDAKKTIERLSKMEIE